MVDIVECVPNFSEGRRRAVIDAVCRAAAGVPGVFVLDVSSDATHNRSVLTLAGPAAAVGEAAFAATRAAGELINMEEHRGEHPRIGAMDVVPFVPAGDRTMADCVALARAVGGRIARELQIPVYLYAEAATRPERRRLADIRRGEYEGLRRNVAAPGREPDFGPPRLHSTAGATAVGARPFLVAFNVDLDSRDLQAARAIAREVRESSGGLPKLQAIGIWARGETAVQVSMNVLDFRVTSLAAALDAVAAAAARRGLAVLSSELVGLVPRAALPADPEKRLSIAGFDPARQVFEERLARMGAAGGGPAGGARS